jgi:hypothetical protein
VLLEQGEIVGAARREIEPDAGDGKVDQRGVGITHVAIGRLDEQLRLPCGRA